MDNEKGYSASRTLAINILTLILKGIILHTLWKYIIAPDLDLPSISLATSIVIIYITNFSFKWHQ